MTEKICKENVSLLWPTETNTRILNYMEIIIEALEEKYNNEVPKRMILQLDLLRDLWKNYFKVSNELAKNDIYLKGEKGRIYQNPALQTQQQLYQRIMDSLKSLGVTLFEEKKFKLIDKKIGTDSDADAAEMMEALLS